MSNKKNLSYVFLSSFLVSSILGSHVSGMENQQQTNVICKQESLLFKGINFITLDDFILSRKEEYTTKGGSNFIYSTSLTEREFIGILIDICDIVEKRLNEQQHLPKDQKDYCKYVSSQSIKIGVDERNNYIVRIDKPATLHVAPENNESTPLFWILNMIAHYLGLNELPRSSKEKENYKSSYPKDDDTFKILGRFYNLADLLKAIDHEPHTPVNNSFVFPKWKNTKEDITIADFIKELKNLKMKLSSTNSK